MPVINPRTGREFNWAKTRATARTRAYWHKKTMYGQTVKGSIRHIAHLDRLNNLARNRYGKEIVIIQSAYNSTIAASKGTHDYDMCVDLYIPGISWWEMQRFFRRNGLGCWYRPYTPGLWSNHIHGFTLPHRNGNVSNDWMEKGFKVGVYVDGGYSLYGHKVTSSQIEDYYNEAFGLKGRHTPGSDHSWFPDDKAATAFDLRAYIERRKKKQAAA